MVTGKNILLHFSFQKSAI